MTPNPRPRGRFDIDDPERRTRIRLDLLIALMVVQLVLSIGLWVDRYKNREVTPAKSATVEVKSEPIYEPEPILQSMPTNVEQPSVAQTQPPSDLGISTPPARIKVQVLNGCGVPGVAKRARDWLIKQDYEIRDVGNADRQDYRISKIVNRSGNHKSARELARLLGIDEAQISRQSGPAGTDFDLTLIIGKDYKRLPFAR